MSINVSIYTQIGFILITLTAFVLFMRAAKKGKISEKQFRNSFFILLTWITIQGILSYLTFFQQDLHIFPPRLAYVLTPNIIMTIFVFFSEKGKRFVDGLHIPSLVLLSLVRIPVEIILYKLYLNHAIPELMTFSGRNFDILAGLSAPIIYYLCYIRKVGTKKLLLGWNIISAGLLMFIIFNAVFSVPSPFRLFGDNQPNIGLLFFPFTWLAAFVAPIVLFSHFVIFRRLLIIKGDIY
ncbi:hypothetical protein SAMN06298216_4018 [Spirosomataceae bacterium TFI 002]|nr:hypothetical protein SAMN06298216_4018 [Spirosomataceae bacterium TFI 002]